ncbi:MAG: GGDEF domain-containing protein [Prochlorotrichaceae cyanobacterium]
MKISKRPNQELKDFFDWGDPLEQETVKFDEYPLILERMILGKVYLPENYLISLPKYFDSLLFPKWLEQISRTLYNIMLFESLRTENVTDPLTGLFNRRYMGNVLNRLTQSTQSDYSIGIMFLDIDYFKRINDEFGHAAGDSVLKDFSIFLKSNIRPTDIACRYGGEEFAVILPGTAPLIVEKKANRICRGLRYLIMRHEQTRIGHITVSIGVAIFPRHGSTATAVLAAADQALYSAKAGGRNQVISAET